MNTITKKILIDRIADTTNMKRVAVKQVVQEFLDQVIVELGEGNRLEFRDFGVFEVKHRAPRIAQNPKTLERVPVPAKRTVKFKVGRRMRDAMETPQGTPEADASPKATTAHQAPQTGHAAGTASLTESKVAANLAPDIVGTINATSNTTSSTTGKTTGNTQSRAADLASTH